MRRRIVLLAALTVLTSAPGAADARGYRGGGNVTTEFGTFSAAEMSAAGGDIYGAAQMREQRMFLQYQQQMYKQQQQMQKQYQDYLKKNPAAAKALQAQQQQQLLQMQQQHAAHVKKKKRTYVPAGTITTGTTAKPAETPKAAKPAAAAK